MLSNTFRRRALRVLAAALVAPAAAAVVTACGSSEPATGADGRTVLRYQGSTGQVQFWELADELGYFSKVQLQWESDTTSGPASIQAAATKQTEFGGAFNGAVVKLAAGGAPVKSVLSYYGSDADTYTGYFVLDGTPITSGRDLIGKKVGVNTLGAHHEFLTREWLHQEGLTPAEIQQVQLIVVPPVNTEQALRSNQIDVAALNGVFRETAQSRGGIHPLFTDRDIFGQASYGSLLFRTDFIERNRDAVADFVQGTARAIRWAQLTPRDEVVAKYAEIIGKRGRNENTDLLEYWRSSGIPVAGGVIADKEIEVWVDWLERNGELDKGQLTAADLFTNEFNPYANGTFEPTSGPTGEAVAAK